MTAAKILTISASLRAASHLTRLPHTTPKAWAGSDTPRDRIAATDGLLATAWSSPR